MSPVCTIPVVVLSNPKIVVIPNEAEGPVRDLTSARIPNCSRRDRRGAHRRVPHFSRVLCARKPAPERSRRVGVCQTPASVATSRQLTLGQPGQLRSDSDEASQVVGSGWGPSEQWQGEEQRDDRRHREVACRHRPKSPQKSESRKEIGPPKGGPFLV